MDATTTMMDAAAARYRKEAARAARLREGGRGGARGLVPRGASAGEEVPLENENAHAWNAEHGGGGGSRPVRAGGGVTDSPGGGWKGGEANGT